MSAWGVASNSGRTAPVMKGIGVKAKLVDRDVSFTPTATAMKAFGEMAKPVGKASMSMLMEAGTSVSSMAITRMDSGGKSGLTVPSLKVSS